MSMRSYALLLCFILTNPALAGTVTVHTANWHHKVENVESLTPGIAYTTDNYWRLGALRNSYRITSVYISKIYPITKTARVGIGIVSGYTWSSAGLRGSRRGIVPLLAIEKDITKNLSVVWFGQALNLELRWTGR